MNNKPLEIEESKLYIEKIDFDLLKRKMEQLTIFNINQINNMCNKYKRFLFLVRKHKTNYNLAPTKEIDLIWHNHILDTKKYINDCNLIFGYYLHHYPYVGLDENVPLQERDKTVKFTTELYEQEFGEPLIQEKLTIIQKIIFSCM